MKRIVLLFMLCMSYMFINADSYHFYTTFEANGELTKYESIFNHYIITINECIKGAYNETRYTSCTITCVFETPVDEDDIEIYRCHADGTHKSSDETGPNWNMKLQPTINPNWCSYSYQLNDENKVTSFTFKDTFNEALLKDENPYVNTLHYIIYDNSVTPRHDIMIQISDIFYYSIITGIDEVNCDNSTIIYYDMMGHSANHPFNGVNIVNDGKRTYKVIR